MRLLLFSSVAAGLGAGVLALTAGIPSEPVQDPVPQAGPREPAADPEPGQPAAPRSVFVMPLALGDEPPPLRSLRNIRLVHAEMEGVSRNVTRTRAETAELAAEIAAGIREGTSFEALARRWSADKNARHGGVLGSFPPGVLGGPFDAFLQAAEVGEVSQVIEDPRGFHLLQRVDTHAAARQILVRGTEAESRTKAEALLARLRAGEDFAELARAHSGDPVSAPRGGLMERFERGPEDASLKAAVFAAEAGELLGPLPTPLGFHVVERIPLDALPPELCRGSFARLRVILVSHRQTPAGSPFADRSLDEARALTVELHQRIAAGEDMAAIAREINDDPTGRERGGDLGWVHRGNPHLVGFLQQAFLVEPGTLLDPITISTAGWAIVRREQ